MSVPDRWVRLYTAGLPETVRDQRRSEIASDVFEQYAATGRSRRVRRAVAGRTVRGAVDDLVWRREVARGMTSIGVRRVLTQAWWAPVAALVALFDVLFGLAVLADEGSSMPGRVVGPVLCMAAAVAVLVGLRLRGNAPAPAAAAAGSGRLKAGLAGLFLVAAGTALVVGGGPLFAIIGAVVVLGALAVTSRTLGAGSNVGAGNALILLGMLPALAMFWLIAPALLALAVIVGVVTGRPRPAVATV
jgi:hypothetical protein